MVEYLSRFKWLVYTSRRQQLFRLEEDARVAAVAWAREFPGEAVVMATIKPVRQVVTSGALEWEDVI